MAQSVRLDRETERALRRIARRRRSTVSDVIRQGIDAIKADESEGLSPYDLIAHLVGSVRGGPPDLSERTGQKFREILLSKRK